MSFLIRIFHSLLNILSKIIHKKIIYTSFESFTYHDAMAVVDNIGFWYVGNLYDSADIAYGIANKSSVEDEWLFVRNILDHLIAKDTSKKMYFYDIGANTGYFGVLAGYISGGRLVSHFFEPLPVHTDCIKKSLYLNRLEDHATIHELWIGNENTQKTFYIAWSGSSLISEFSWSGSTGTCTISVQRLDDYQREKDLWLPDFIKIDVEGNEYDVIRGGMKTFEQSYPVLYVEIAKDLRNIGRDFENEHFSEIFTLLGSIGYVALRVSDDYKNVTPYTENNQESWVHMYLFLHPLHHRELIAQYAN